LKSRTSQPNARFTRNYLPAGSKKGLAAKTYNPINRQNNANGGVHGQAPGFRGVKSE